MPGKLILTTVGTSALTKDKLDPLYLNNLYDNLKFDLPRLKPDNLRAWIEENPPLRKAEQFIEYYVDALLRLDIAEEVKKPPKFTNIFSAELTSLYLMSEDIKFSVQVSQTELDNELDKKIISDKLRKEFENNNIILSQSATVSIEVIGNKWQLNSEQKAYTIRKEERKLNIYDEFSLNPEIDTVILLLSESSEGVLAGLINKRCLEQGKFLKSCPIIPQVTIVPDLQVENLSKFIAEGLKKFIRCIRQYTKAEPTKQAILNTTGGFKSLIPYATYLSLVFQIPMVFVFEELPKLIKINPIILNPSPEQREKLLGMRKTIGDILSEQISTTRDEIEL